MGHSCDERRTDGGNGRQIAGLRSALTQKPTRGRNPGKHGVGGAANMGSVDQRRPPQDCLKVPIQSRPRRGVNP